MWFMVHWHRVFWQILLFCTQKMCLASWIYDFHVNKSKLEHGACLFTGRYLGYGHLDENISIQYIYIYIYMVMQVQLAINESWYGKSLDIEKCLTRSNDDQYFDTCICHHTWRTAKKCISRLLTKSRNTVYYTIQWLCTAALLNVLTLD